MKYRKFGPLEWEASVLGLGTARLPDAKKPSIGLIRAAIDRGVNYLDVGYTSDPARRTFIAGVIGEALRSGYRDKVKLAVTLPVRAILSTAGLEMELIYQLRLLRADSVDFCLLARLNRENWPVLNKLGVLKWAEAAIEKGKVRHMGFFFHDQYQVLKSILESWDKWTFCQVQFSYMDIDHDPGIAGIKYAAGKGLAVVVTEPLKMGRLDDCGLRYVWDRKEVATAILDFASMPELYRSADLAARAIPGSLTVSEEVMLGRVRDAYLVRKPLSCPSCRACMPCPEGIDVPRIFELYNDAFMYGDRATARRQYLNESHRADLCTECGACEDACAKGLPVLQWLQKARLLFHEDAAALDKI